MIRQTRVHGVHARTHKHKRSHAHTQTQKMHAQTQATQHKPQTVTRRHPPAPRERKTPQTHPKNLWVLCGTARAWGQGGVPPPAACPERAGAGAQPAAGGHPAGGGSAPHTGHPGVWPMAALGGVLRCVVVSFLGAHHVICFKVGKQFQEKNVKQ